MFRKDVSMFKIFKTKQNHGDESNEKPKNFPWNALWLAFLRLCLLSFRKFRFLFLTFLFKLIVSSSNFVLDKEQQQVKFLDKVLKAKLQLQHLRLMEVAKLPDGSVRFARRSYKVWQSLVPVQKKFKTSMETHFKLFCCGAFLVLFSTFLFQKFKETKGKK